MTSSIAGIFALIEVLALGRLLDSALQLDAVAGRQAVAQRL